MGDAMAATDDAGMEGASDAGNRSDTSVGPRDDSGGSNDAASDMGVDTAIDADAGMDAGNDASFEAGGDGAVGCHPVINELQTASSSSGNDKWIEIFNPCSVSVNLTSYVLAYRSASGTSDVALYTFSQTLAARAYLLIADASAAIEGGVVPDGTWSASALAQAGGGVGLRDPSTLLVDAVGYGNAASTNAFVEGTPAGAPPKSGSIGRSPNGVDTNDNANDFKVYVTPSPRAANP
jgi:hypothetical protein